jgi:hypothetical protein
MDARRRGWVLFWLAAAFLLPAVFLGLSKSGRPAWEPGRGLFAPGGAVLMIYGALVWLEQARWIGLGADEPRRSGSVLFVLGLALVGAGLAHMTQAEGWRLLTIPAIIGGGLFSLREAWRGKRGALHRINHFASRHSWWMTRAGLWLFGLTWPLFVLWALGLQSFE